MNQNSPIFFIGFAIFVLFGFKFFLFVAICYGVYKFLIEPIFKEQTKKQKKGFNWEETLNEIFQQKSSITEAEVVTPKQSKKQQSPSSINFSFMDLLNLKRIIPTIITLIGVMLIIDGFVMVPAGHVAVILDRGRGVLEEPLPTGLHLKIPFWQKTTEFDTRLQTYTMSIAASEGELYGNDAIEALTKDGQQVKVDLTVQFYLPPQNASDIYANVGLNYVDKIVRPAARSIVRNVITGFNSKELFAIETRQEAQTAIKTAMTENFESKNLILDDILLRNVQFSDVYLKAIEEKQIAEQKIQKAEFEKQEALIIKEKKIIEAEAEAEAITLKGDALKNSPKVIELEMVQKLSPNIDWGVLPDGVLPMLNMGDIKK
jgi:regulator of protease activity HflC (stomatin/prohibitin superfamily)